MRGKVIALVAGVGIVALALGLLIGNSLSSSKKTSASSPTTIAGPDTPTTAPSTSGQAGATRTTTPSGPQAHANGRFPAYIRSVDVASKTLVVDEIQFLTGDAARAAYQADNPGASDGPPNDYYIKNVNPLLTSVRVSSGAAITVNALSGNSDPTTDVSVDLATLANDLHRTTASVPFWITVSGGVGTQIHEQFVP